ncbi:uncharacterized protein [Oscarella lobularis]|uniref:uncharacterized protein n=1 Tax=Oscarella lobularis TaxID=121494 RepID=UPI003313D6EE
MLKLKERRSQLFLFMTCAAVLIGKSSSQTRSLGNCNAVFDSEEVPGVVSADISADGQGGVKVSIALEVPRGSGGRQPGLLLKYSSSAGNGRFGYGWTLAYLPTISRCPRKRLKNGYSDMVNFTANDVYCVGGKQLVPVPDTEFNADVYDGSKYYSEEFDKTLYQPFGYRSADGPLYWISSSSDGVLITYGRTINSRVLAETANRTVILAWKPSQEIDPYGNEVNIAYDGNGKDNSEIYMSNITYAEDQAAVVFDYEPRPDEIETYYSGSIQRISRRLRRVTTYSAMPTNENLSEKTKVPSVLKPVRRYNITYAISTLNGVSLIDTITVCSGCYEKCQRPFRFQYEMVSDDTEPIAWPFPLNTTTDDSGMFTLFSPKIQNDTSSGAFKSAAFCNMHKHEPIIYPLAVSATEANVQLSADANSDGLTDLMFFQYDSKVGLRVNIYLSNGKSFYTSNIVSKFQPTEPFVCGTTEVFCSCWPSLLDYENAIYKATGEFHSTSFTVFEDNSRGEGKIDLIAVVLTNGPQPHLTSENGSCTLSMPPVYILEVSKNHKTDVAPTGKLTAYSNGITFQYTQNCSVMYGDVTDDFAKDVIISCLEADGWKIWTIDLSSESVTLSEPYSFQNKNDGITRNVLLQDLNGDGSPELTMVELNPATIDILVAKSLRNGKFDFVVKNQTPYGFHNIFDSKSITSFFAPIPGGATNLVISSTSKSAWYLYRFESKGNGIFTGAIEESMNSDFPQGTVVFANDINGDDIPEILAVNPGKSTSTGLRLWVLYLRPVRKFREYSYPPIPSANLTGKYYDEANSLYYSDFTGDGKTDIGIVRVRYLDKKPYCSELATNFYLLPSSLLVDVPFNKLTEMKDGHDLTTAIAYSRMTNKDAYIPEGSAPKQSCTAWPDPKTTATRQPYVDFTPFSQFLVQEISHSNAASDDPNNVITTKYVYRGYGRHTQGYGSLGFEFVFGYHSPTGHSQLTTYSTDFVKHTHGHPVSTATYKCDADKITPILLSTQTNQWQLMTRIPSALSPGFLFGSYFVSLIDQENSVYSEYYGSPQTTLHKVKVVVFNSYGLPTKTISVSNDISSQSKPYPHLYSSMYNKTLEIDYLKPLYHGYSWFVGLASVATETSISNYGEINSEIDYSKVATVKRAEREYNEDGSLHSEIFSSSNTSNPSDLEHTLTIIHQRDQKGNIIGASFVSLSGVQVANKTMKYDVNGRFQTSLCSSRDVCKNWLYGHNGELLAEMRSTGERIIHTYDEFFREMKVNSSFGKMVETTFGFCDKMPSVCADFPTAMYFKNTTSMFGTSVYDIYDKLDRTLGSTLLLNEKESESELIQNNVYDNFGGIAKRTPIHYASDLSHETMFFEKDDFGRITIIRRTYQQPDTTGKSTSVWQETALKYLSNRVDIITTDSSNAKPWKQTRITDSQAQVSVTEETNTDHTLLYWYSPKGDVVATVINNTAREGALVYRAQFDKFGAPFEIAFGNSGRYQYAHDTFGQLLNQTDPSGNVVLFRRNDQEKVTSIIGLSGQSEKTVFAHNFTYNERFLDKIDQEHGLTESGKIYHVNNAYDSSRGLLINTTVSLNNQTTSLAYTYDADNNNRLERITYPDGINFLYNYDDKNRINQIFDGSNANKPLWSALEFDEEGRPSKELYGNGLQTEKSFDPWGISFTTTLLPNVVTTLQNVERMAQNEPAFSFSAKFDPSGRVILRERYVKGRRIYSEEVSYDQDYQSINKTTLYFNESYSVDPVVFSYGNYSNLVRKSDVGNYKYREVSSFGEDYVKLIETTPVNHVTAVETSNNSSYTFKHDKRGNRYLWNGTVITYNSRNKPVTILRGPLQTSFEYSPIGKLLTKADAVFIKFGSNATAVPVTYRQTWYVNDLYEEELVRENLSSPAMSKKIQRFYASTNVLLQKTTYLNSSEGASTQSHFYLHYDTKDSLVHVTDEKGSTVWEADYDVCGRKRNSASGKSESRYDKVLEIINRTALTLNEAQEILTSLRSNFTMHIGYDGHNQLFELGDDLVHMRGRLYDTIHCLFLSPDPYLGNRWRTVGYNSYSYGEFNLLSSTDPSGYVSLVRRIIAAVLRVLEEVLMKIVSIIAEATGQMWLDALAALWDFGVTMGLDFLDGDNWKSALIDASVTLLKDAISMVTDGIGGEKMPKLKHVVTTALDGAKGAATAAVSGRHSYKTILLSAGIGLAEGMVDTIADGAETYGLGVTDPAASATESIGYSSASNAGGAADIPAISAKLAIATTSAMTKEGLKIVEEVIDHFAFDAKEDIKEAEFLSKGMSSMQTATKTDGPLLFSNELKASAEYDYMSENALKNSQFSHLLRSFMPKKGAFSIDALAGIEKASDSFGRSYVALHNHAVIRTLFAAYEKKSAREELFLFDRVSQLILAPSAHGKFLQQT